MTFVQLAVVVVDGDDVLLLFSRHNTCSSSLFSIILTSQNATALFASFALTASVAVAEGKIKL